MSRAILSEHFIGHGARQGQPKRAFPDRQSALAFSLRTHGPAAGHNVYRCSFCEQWHISPRRDPSTPGR